MSDRFRAMLRTWLTLSACLTLGLILLPATGKAVDVAADTVTRAAGGALIAEGNVIIQKESETLAADQVIYDAKKKSFKAKGNVVITSAGSSIKAESGKMHTVNKTGELHNAEATMKGGERLKAKLLTRDENGIITAEDATVTSCPVDAETWVVKAGSAELDQENGWLTARNARFELAGVPIFYTPYWQQALRRKSGFLIPYVSTSKTRGTEVALPYYLAPAENWDATLTPHWMTARGFKGDVELRHASPLGREEIQVEGLNDKVVSHQRSRLRGDIQRSLPYNINFDANADHVSDHKYLADFATDGDTISKSYLQSKATLSQNVELGDWSLLVRHQQDLTSPSNAKTLQILPRFESGLRLPLMDRGAAFHFDQQSTLFSRKLGEDGWRVDLNPYLEIPWQLSGGGLRSTLKVGGRHTHYWLNDTVGQSTPDRNTFEASLDTRASFEHISDNRQWRHTISPILRYDFITAPDQSALPNFDSSFGKLSMSNLLTGNRFTGKDRVERINRVSLLFETGLQHKDKAGNVARDIVNAKVGAAYDLQRETVDGTILPAPTRPFSNLLGEIAIHPTSNIHLSANGQYDPIDKFWATSYAALSMGSQTGHHLNVSWQRTNAKYATAAEFVNMDATIRLSQRWSVFGTWQYDRLLKITQRASGGLDYRHPCWDMHIEGFRNQLNGTASSSDYGFRFLLGFRGLGSVGS
ncbi:MAG: LPS assembly protein LptD [Mariprofundaceae bacterium]